MKPEYPEKTSRCRVENQQTQPTYDAGSRNRTRATLVGDECSHHCAIPAPPITAWAEGRTERFPIQQVKCLVQNNEIASCSLTTMGSIGFHYLGGHGFIERTVIGRDSDLIGYDWRWLADLMYISTKSPQLRSKCNL